MTKELYNTLRSLELSEEYVFTNPDTSTCYMYKKGALAALCERAGIKRFTFHAFRHYGASVLAKKNVPLPDIQAILGHESLTTTALYIQSLVGHTSKYSFADGLRKICKWFEKFGDAKRASEDRTQKNCPIKRNSKLTGQKCKKINQIDRYYSSFFFVS